MTETRDEVRTSLRKLLEIHAPRLRKGPDVPLFTPVGMNRRFMLASQEVVFYALNRELMNDPLANPMSCTSSQELDLVKQEYHQIRHEIIQAMNNGNQIMTFGLATIGVILYGLADSKNIVLSYWILSLFLPMLAFLVLFMWFSEQLRLARASYFLTGCENKIAVITGVKGLMEWECWLRDSAKNATGRNRHFPGAEYSAIAIFVLLIIGSQVIGFFVGTDVSLNLRIWILCAMGTLTVAVLGRFIVTVKEWRTRLDSRIGIDELPARFSAHH